ncbi:hypothetical protein [Pseudoxanthomonas beigongshangi]|uniref:hypothetical protein n=1 Tax=Pseudoxanthomonas beigongshangi TaxID=2782537 RepID=UPI00193C587D|nr:hypothetical protein [Pseudoxanthomonas beigongshangi]
MSVITNLSLAKQVAPHVDLQTVVVRQATLEADFDPLDLPAELTLETSYRSTYAVRSDRDGQKRIAVTIEFRFNSRSLAEGEPSGSALKIDATFLLLYTIAQDKDFEPRCFEYFAQVNGAYNAWPYWREFVQSATGRAGLPGVVVPVFRVVPEKVEDMNDCSSGADPTLLGTTPTAP